VSRADDRRGPSAIAALSRAEHVRHAVAEPVAHRVLAAGGQSVRADKQGRHGNEYKFAFRTA